ncbi:hypothetical protein [Pseudactinotalea terrae]|uniref:hypothetical protein n=1 Tax=Pseudactinotalea terrae TaxID=1743262 RepID=UPI0012E23EBD|nr:hypothetical protein [Pseudactinotalea terrae]
MPAQQTLPLKSMGIVLGGVTLLLIALDQLLFNIRPGEKLDALLYIYFDVTREGNVPTFWNAALLLWVGAAAALVAYLSPGRAVGWWVTAGVATLMSLDETVQIHEHLRGLGNAIQTWLGVTFPTFTWLIPGVLIALAGAVMLWIWSGRQPTTTRRGLRLAVVLYGSGVVVVEAVGGMVWRVTAGGSAYQAMAGLEELLEMAGAIVALLAVLGMLGVTQMGQTRSISAMTAASF